MERHRYFRFALVTAAALLPLKGSCDYLQDIGYRTLESELGPALPDGAPIRIDQIEASTAGSNPDPIYRADPSDSRFSGVTFFDQSAGVSPLFSAHATGVAASFAGNDSITPGVTAVDSYEANDWLVGVLYNDNSGLVRPVTGTGVLANHSWVGAINNADGTINAPQTADVLGRLDWLTIQSPNFINVVGTANPSGTPPRDQTLLSHAYNVIAVAATPAPITSPSAAVDAFYVSGRGLPHLTAPWPNVSGAVPIVTSAVALLMDAAPSNTLPSETVKALLMAGADRATDNSDASSGNLTDYNPAGPFGTVNGLDRRYGAGQLNILHSYHLLSGGEKNSVEDGGTGSAASGYDFDAAFGGSSSTNSTASYSLGTRTQPGKLSVALVWNAFINDPSGAFNPTRTLYNLDLQLIDTTNGGNTVVASSTSTIDNTENLWADLQTGHSYKLSVIRGNATLFNWRYAIAWRTQDLPPSESVPVPMLPGEASLSLGGALSIAGFSRLARRDRRRLRR